MAELYRDRALVPPDASCSVVRLGTDRRDLMNGDPAPWAAVPAIEWGPPAYRTAFRAGWTPEALVVRFDVQDRAPWHTLTARDAHLWEEEVVELFLDPLRTGRDYVEIEISPANVVCDLRVHTPWPLLRSDCHWHWNGLESEVVRQDGTDDWIAVARLPWTGLPSLSDGVSDCVPPRIGDRWRFNVFRIKRPNGPAAPENDAIYAAWSVPHAPSFHVPASFRDLVFAS